MLRISHGTFRTYLTLDLIVKVWFVFIVLFMACSADFL
jgi:hypothetical protein